MTLTEQIRQESLASYARMRGGFFIPLAGAVYWGVLAGLGYRLPPHTWSIIAFALSGAIFPLALLFASVARKDIFKERTAVTSVLLPTFASMLLFWPMAVAALWEANGLTPLILAIGMSIHWPVIGWSYGRPAPYIAHAVVRAVVTFAIWKLLPEARLTLLPLSVSVIYILTALFLFIDSGRMKSSPLVLATSMRAE
jgi:hypothetical protein